MTVGKNKEEVVMKVIIEVDNVVEVEEVTVTTMLDSKSTMTMNTPQRIL